MLQRYSSTAYSLMRSIVGSLYACHGAQKLFGVLGGHKELHDPWGLAAGIIEFFGGFAIALGLFASLPAFFACGEMALAYFKAHAPPALWPLHTRGGVAGLP